MIHVWFQTAKLHSGTNVSLTQAVVIDYYFFITKYCKFVPFITSTCIRAYRFDYNRILFVCSYCKLQMVCELNFSEDNAKH